MNFVRRSSILVLLLSFTSVTQAQLNFQLQSGRFEDGVFFATNTVQTWTFPASQGEVILLRTAKVDDESGEGAKPWAVLKSPSGATLQRNHFNGGDTEDTILHTAASSGTYTLEVQTFDLNATGQYRIGLAVSNPSYATQDDGGVVSNGQTVDAFLERGDVDMWTINAKVGEEIFIRGAAFGSNPVKPWFRLHNPSGSLAVQSFFNGGDYEDVSAYVATQTGPHILVVSSWNRGDSGDYRLGVSLSNTPFTIQDDGGTALSGNLISGNIIKADVDIWEINVEAGAEIFTRGTRISSDGVKPWIRIYDPDGELLGSGHYNGGDTQDILIVSTSKTGRHRVLVSSWIKEDTGAYRIGVAISKGPFLVEDEGGNLSGSSTVGGSLPLADVDIYTFTAAAGGSVNVRASVAGSSGAKPWVRLYRPDGSLAASGHFNGGDTVDFLKFYPSVTGVFTAIVSAWTGEGGYTVDFTVTPPSILFIPGIGGSRLTGGGHTGARGNYSYLWPTVRPDKIEELNLTTGVADVEAVDVVRTFPVSEDLSIPGITLPEEKVYGPFLNFLKAQGYVEFDLAEDPTRLASNYLRSQNWSVAPNLFIFPYDWRLDNASHMQDLRSYIANIRDIHDGRKIHIVAHSMGGLLVRRYLLDYGADDVASVTTIGSPVWGAPQAVFRLLTGTFFGPNVTSAVDWINEDSLRDTLWSMPSVAQLLPSNEYIVFQGGFILAEAGWDLNSNGDDDEIYDPLEYAAFLSEEAERQSSPFDPIIVSQLFNNPLQTDWSALPETLPALIISGNSSALGAFPSTPIGVLARSGPWYTSLNPGGVNANVFQYERFDPVYGLGDGTVPLLSAERLSSFLPPNRQEVRISGGSEANHVGLLSENTQVWQAILNFINQGSTGLPQALSLSQPQVLTKSPSGSDSSALSNNTADSITSILIKGRSYVSVMDDAGNANTRLSAAAALSIPGVEIDYAQNSVLVEFASGKAIVIASDETGETMPLEIEILQTDIIDDERNLTGLKRYQITDGSVLWRLTQDSSSESTLLADLNGDGLLDSSDGVLPSYDSSDGDLDGIAPTISLQLQSVGSELIINLDARDDHSASPRILYAVDGRNLAEYSSPLRIPQYESQRLIAFSEDEAGNKSGLIETVVNPSLELDGQNAPSTVKLLWPLADGYRLEFSDQLSGDWDQYRGPYIRVGTKIEVTFPIESKTIFFRLRSIGVEK